MNLMSEEGREGPERSALSASESPTAIHCAKFEAGFRACERSLRIWRDTFPDHRSSGIHRAAITYRCGGSTGITPVSQLSGRGHRHGTTNELISSWRLAGVARARDANAHFYDTRNDAAETGCLVNEGVA